MKTSFEAPLESLERKYARNREKRIGNPSPMSKGFLTDPRGQSVKLAEVFKRGCVTAQGLHSTVGERKRCLKLRGRRSHEL